MKNQLTCLLRFRWVSLQLQYLSTIKLVGLVEERLGRLPQRLHKIYEETYKKRFCEYADEEKALVQCALRWLLCSEVPLDTETFLRLTSSSSYQKGVDELSRDTLLGLCFNFIVHDAELDIFRFAHLSVREYLESVDSYQLDASHAFAAGYCLNLLMFKLTIKPELHPSEARTQDDAPGLAVIEYTHFFWGAHLKRCGRHRFSEPLRTLFSDFTLDQYGVSSSFSHWNENCYSIENSDDLHDTRKQRSGGILPRIRHSFWESPCRVSQMLSHPANVLFTASFWDFEELMERWTNMNPECKDIRNQDCRKARGIACQRGSFKVVRLLIEHFVPIEEESAHHKSERHQDLTRAFESAVCCGHTDTVHILVEKRVIPDAWAYALKSAVFWGNANIVKMLLENDIDLCAKDCVGPATVYTSSSVFFKAIYGGHMGIVKMLCEVAGVREASQGPWLAGTELMRTLRDRGGVTTLLQREGFKDLVDKAALAPAVFLSLEHSDFETAGTLVTMGADPNFQWENSEGSSILREAIYKSTYIPRAAAFVELMLDYGADVDRCCSADQSTPIEFAVNFGGEAAVALLLKKNARCDRVDYPIVFPRPSGVVGSLFDIAESRGYLAIAQLLKEHGCVSAKSCPQSHDSWSWKCWKSKRY